MRRFPLFPTLMFILAMPAYPAVVFYGSQQAWEAVVPTANREAVQDFSNLTPQFVPLSSVSIANGAVYGMYRAGAYTYPGTYNPNNAFAVSNAIGFTQFNTGTYLITDTASENVLNDTLTVSGVEKVIDVNGDGSVLATHNDSTFDTAWTPNGPHSQEAAFRIDLATGMTAIRFVASSHIADAVARALKVTLVTTSGNITRTVFIPSSTTMQFFGFATDDGALINQVYIAGISLAGASLPTWQLNGNEWTRNWNQTFTPNNGDSFRIALDNVQFGTYETGGPPPPPPPTGEVPEASTFLLAGAGLVAIGVLRRRS